MLTSPMMKALEGARIGFSQRYSVDESHEGSSGRVGLPAHGRSAKGCRAAEHQDVYLEKA